jgi:hypothetical protein
MQTYVVGIIGITSKSRGPSISDYLILHRSRFKRRLRLPGV